MIDLSGRINLGRILRGLVIWLLLSISLESWVEVILGLRGLLLELGIETLILLSIVILGLGSEVLLRGLVGLRSLSSSGPESLVVHVLVIRVGFVLVLESGSEALLLIVGKLVVVEPWVLAILALLM